jgi:hypothetical protein
MPCDEVALQDVPLSGGPLDLDSLDAGVLAQPEVGSRRLEGKEPAARLDLADLVPSAAGAAAALVSVDPDGAVRGHGHDVQVAVVVQVDSRVGRVHQEIAKAHLFGAIDEPAPIEAISLSCG